MNPKIIITADNSPTLYLPELDEHYHSINGALQESLHVFINAGLKQLSKNNINILEVGFGTGLNAVLTFNEILSSNKKVFYHGIEKYPLKDEIINNLSKETLFNSDVFLNIHNSKWEQEVEILENFTLFKQKVDLKYFIPLKKYDLIYFDAFSPDKQSELWTENIFFKLYQATKQNGILVTYSSKGIVKQALRKVGYEVKRLKGPSGKRHMVKAIKVNPYYSAF